MTVQAMNQRQQSFELFKLRFVCRHFILLIVVIFVAFLLLQLISFLLSSFTAAAAAAAMLLQLYLVHFFMCKEFAFSFHFFSSFVFQINIQHTMRQC